MRKLGFAFLLIFFASLPSFAQTTAVSGTVKDSNGIVYAGATLKAQLVLAGGGLTGQATVTVNNQQQCISAGQGSAPCQVPFQGTAGPITLNSSGTFSLTLQDNTQVTPSGTQWLFSVTTQGSPPPLGTGPQACTATLTISGASQSVSGSFSACPALSSVTGSTPATGIAGITPQQALLFSSFQRHVDWSCSWGAGTPTTVTCTDAPFISSMSTWLGFATSAVQGNDQQFNLLCGSNSADTPITFISASQVSINCTSPNSGTNPFIFGPDETGHATGCSASTLTPVPGTCDGISGLIKTAALACAVIHWPSAAAIVKSNPFVNPPVTNCANPVSIQRSGVGVIGDNPGPSQLTFYPNFNWTTCNLGAGTGCIAANGSNIAGGYMLENFALNSFGTPMNPGSAHNLIEFEANTFGQHFYCLGIGGQNTNLTGYRFGTIPFNGVDIQSDACGAHPLDVETTNGGSTCDQCYFGDSSDGVVINGQFTSTKTIYGPMFVGPNHHMVAVNGAGASFNSSQDIWLGSTFSQGAQVKVTGANASATLNNDSILDARPSGATLYCNSTTGTITLNGRNIVSGVGTNALSYFSDQTGCALNDMGNTKWSETSQNTYTGTTFSGLPGVTQLQGSCTGTATSSVTLGLYGLGENSAATCTSTTTTLGIVMTKTGNIGALIVSAGTGGSTAGSGAVTVLKNGAAFGTSVTCTVGTGTSCIDTTHGLTATFVAGDIISVQMVTGAAETLANVKVNIIVQGTT